MSASSTPDSYAKCFALFCIKHSYRVQQYLGKNMFLKSHSLYFDFFACRTFSSLDVKYPPCKLPYDIRRTTAGLSMLNRSNDPCLRFLAHCQGFTASDLFYNKTQ